MYQNFNFVFIFISYHLTTVIQIHNSQYIIYKLDCDKANFSVYYLWIAQINGCPFSMRCGRREKDGMKTEDISGRPMEKVAKSEWGGNRAEREGRKGQDDVLE